MQNRLTSTLLSAFPRSLAALLRRVLQAATPHSRSFPVSVGKDAFVSSFSQAIASMPIRQQQSLMLRLYRSNMYVRRFTDSLVSPIVGSKGCSIHCDKVQYPQTASVIRRFTTFNELYDVPTQIALVRDILVVGEAFFLAIPHERRLTFQLMQIPPTSIKQTICDVQNVNRVMAVEQWLDGAVSQSITHRLITDDEERFSDDAQAYRAELEYQCFGFQNIEQTDPLLAATTALMQTDALHKYERRGRPLLITSADLLEKLLTYLWNSVDKADAWNTFCWVFDVDTSRATSDAEAEAIIKKWRENYGTPQHNTSIFLPSGITMSPQTFPMHGGDLSIVQRMIQNSAAWTAYMRATEMDESGTRYATNTQTMVSEPTVEKKEELQTTQLLRPLHQMIDFVCDFAYRNHEIPKEELKETSFPYEFNYELFGNEISPRNATNSAAAFDTTVKTLLSLESRITPESLTSAIIKKADELHGLELVAQEMSAQPLPGNVISLVERKAITPKIEQGELIEQQEDVVNE